MSTDFKFLTDEIKKIRETRQSKFNDNWLDLLEEKYKIIFYENSNKYEIYTNDEKLGIIDFFPKVNKVLIRKQNKWVKPGLKFLLNHLISHNEKQNQD